GEDIPAFKTYSGEILAPIRTLMAARVNRGSVSFWNSFGSLCPTCFPFEMKIEDAIRTQTLGFEAEPLPLGWFIGAANRKRIWDNVGDNRRCGFRSGQAQVPRRYEGGRLNNDCLYEYI